MSTAYIVEHMEPDEDDPQVNSIPPWVLLEYSHMRTLAGPDSQLLFTHLSSKSCQNLSEAVSKNTANDLASVRCYTEGVLDVLKERNVPIERVCLLDPKAPQVISPEDGELFDCFLFGGILGDDPPRDRTSELRALGFPGRHLGPVQMTTDTALGVTKIVVADKVKLDAIPYVDQPTIRFSAKESVEMPFRYIKKNNEPLLPPGMKDLLKEDLNKGFEF